MKAPRYNHQAGGAERKRESECLLKPNGEATPFGCEPFAAHELLPCPDPKIEGTSYDQADRTISTSQLHPSLGFHIWPINVVVFHGSQGNLVSRAASRLDAFSGYPFRT